MLQPLDAVVPDPDVVRGPQVAELRAERGQLADELELELELELGAHARRSAPTSAS
jgi:hypothetical protein